MEQRLLLKNIISFLMVVDTIPKPLVIYCDNKSAVLYSKNKKKSSATRLMNVKFLSVKENVRKGVLSIEQIDLASMIADHLTKPLAVRIFKEHVAKVGILGFFYSTKRGSKSSYVFQAFVYSFVLLFTLCM